MVRVAFGRANTKAFSGPTLLALLSVFFTGCANSCFFAFSNPSNGTIGIVVSDPPPACKLATAKGAIRILIQASRSCEPCSGSNRVDKVVLTLNSIDLHSSAKARDESSGWVALLPELRSRPRQIELLSEKMNALSSESTEGLPISAGSYDLVRLSLVRDQVHADDKPWPGNACSQAGPNCGIMPDGQIAPLVLGADTLEFRLTSEATVDRLPFVLPGSDNELLIELKPVLSIGVAFGQPLRLISTFPGSARMEPKPSGKDPI